MVYEIGFISSLLLDNPEIGGNSYPHNKPGLGLLRHNIHPELEKIGVIPLNQSVTRSKATFIAQPTTRHEWNPNGPFMSRYVEKGLRCGRGCFRILGR